MSNPFDDELPEVAAFELDLLPVSFQAYAEDCAELLQVPVDFIAAPLMIFAGSTIGRQVGIHPQRFTGWTEFPNFCGGIVGSPGLRKSASISAAGKAFRKLADRAGEEFSLDLAMLSVLLSRKLIAEFEEPGKRAPRFKLFNKAQQKS